MFIAVNKRFKKVPKKVWLIEGVYYTTAGQIVDHKTHYICTTDEEVKECMRSIMAQQKINTERLKWAKI